MKVNHNNFGIGTVISEDAVNITVDFNNNIKILVKKFARLTDENGTPLFESAKKEIKVKKNYKSVSNTPSTEVKERGLFLNADGSRNWEAYNDWVEAREEKRRNVISW